MKGFIRIDPELCKGCGYCIESCPMAVIATGDAFNSTGVFPAVVVAPEKCTGCALCARMCPEIAIEVFVQDAEQETA